MSFDFKRAIKFEHNVGCKEKMYRIYAGSAALFISIFTASIALLVVGLILVATGYSGWCPVYSGLEKNTNEVNAAPEQTPEATS
jgi:hypothetical protein